MLSGRALPSFPGVSSDCTTDYKILPQLRLRKRLFAQWAARGLPPSVTILGLRFEESTVRAGRMRSRGDNATVPVPSKDGDLVLAPIADWSKEDVFEHLGDIASGLEESYTDCKEVLRIYAHAAGTSCAVVAADIHATRQRSACGARLGCHTCLRVENDASLEAMIAFDERYHYARGLNRLNKLLQATRWDWNRRNWIGRTIKGGYIEIAPDTYSAAFTRELTRYMLQLDYDEECRARAAGERPRFELLPLEMMIAVDAMQNLHGNALPFQTWADWDAIRNKGVRYDIPEVAPVKQTPMPTPRYLFVGDEWDAGAVSGAFTGLRSDYLEALCADTPCAPKLTETRNGAVWDLPRQDEFDIDPESAMIADFEVEHLLRMHAQGIGPGGICLGYKWYAQFGCLQLSHGQLAKHDEILRRTACKDHLGLTLLYSLPDLLARSVPLRALPPAARLQWMSPSARKGKTQQLAFDMDQ